MANGMLQVQQLVQEIQLYSLKSKQPFWVALGEKPQEFFS